jgi:tRNA pseudouridine38-40 synthase
LPYTEDHFTYKLNQLLPKDIVIYEVAEQEGIHARFDAIKRGYTYRIHIVPSPFKRMYSWYLPASYRFEVAKLHDVAAMFLRFDDFYTFCKTRTDVKTTACSILESRWEISDDDWTYHVSADRFLRGMVRLLVGCMLNVASGKISQEEVREALETSRRLKKDWSVPPEGLTLSEVAYPSTPTGVSTSS